MASTQGVVWSQGLFLQPQHFQQEMRHVEHLVDARVRSAFPHAWGFSELVLDEAALPLGRIGIVRASGVLPDGTPFSMPDAGALPSPLDVPPDLQSERVCLAVPRARTGVNEVDFGDASGDRSARYAAIGVELRDATRVEDDPEPVQLAALRLRLLRERDAGDAYAALAVARVLERRADGQVLLDRGYLAAQTRIEASGQLSATAVLLLGLVRQRAQALADSLGQLGHGVSEVADFLMLQLLNRFEPVLAQFAAAPSVHPWHFHLACLQLAGELATFSAAGRRPPGYPAYRHDDLQGVFAPVLADLREHLSAPIQRHAVPIELVDRSHGVRTAVVSDTSLLRSAGFVLGVRAALPPEQLRARFAAQCKLGPVDRIKELVNLQLPGIGLRALPVAPRQLPFHAGSHYFELDRQGELWKALERSGNLALHVAGDFPGLELELWAVRED
ncbi:MAG TPA: type VI secretion system baseplate subunit TssK [Rubrivivax sp.]|mgnify:CR=1 FL=1|nr:type VI secretion system baseplate subunit TssK [Rubrivivax sp.]HMR68668.1 type VI secretion system baseplate subunit TssK [Rubrivivax sp.]